MSLSYDEQKRRLEVLRGANMITEEQYQTALAALGAQDPELVPQKFKKAPYRFVELPDDVAPPDETVGKRIRGEVDKGLLDCPLDDGFCGEIALKWEAETPLLIGAAAGAGESIRPLQFGQESDYWIPGASFRGMIRAAAEILCHGRLEFADRKVAFTHRPEGKTRVPCGYSVGQVVDRQTRHRLSAAKCGDMATALFGFVSQDGAGGAEWPALKSRVAFSGARIAKDNAIVDARSIDTVTMQAKPSYAPFYLRGEAKDWNDANARIAGRKRYVPRPTLGEASALQDIRARLEQQRDRLGEVARNNQQAGAILHLLQSKSGLGLKFESRVRLHNVLPAEIGLLLWALTHGGDASAKYRHMIGRARPYGAGQLRLVTAKLTLEANGREGARFLARDAATNFAFEDADQSLFIASFEELMSKALATARGGLRKDFRSEKAVQQFLAACDPATGKAMGDKEADGVYLSLAEHIELKKNTAKPQTGSPKWRRPDILLPAKP